MIRRVVNMMAVGIVGFLVCSSVIRAEGLGAGQLPGSEESNFTYRISENLMFVDPRTGSIYCYDDRMVNFVTIAAVLTHPSSQQFKTAINFLDEEARGRLFDELMAIDLVTYYYRGDDSERLGVIAENIPSYLRSADGKSVRLADWIALVHMGVQELQVMLTTHEEQIQRLEARIATLEADVAFLLQNCNK